MTLIEYSYLTGSAVMAERLDVLVSLCVCAWYPVSDWGLPGRLM